MFRIGSVTKTMTALALLRQWEAGRFDLDDPVNDHLSGLELVGRPGWAAPTIRHLLTHTAGDRRAVGMERRAASDGRARDARRVSAAPNAAARYGGRLRLDVEPGTKWAYANHGFNVLGYLVEQMSGEPYGEHMRSVLFDPLGMDDTDVERSERVRGRARDGLRQPAGAVSQSPRDIDVETDPAGSVFSTLPDMAAYAAALLDGGQGIVKPDTLAMAFEPHYRPCPSHPGHRTVVLPGRRRGSRTVGHGGGIPGFVTAFALAPDDGVGVVAFTNGGGQAVCARRAPGAVRIARRRCRDHRVRNCNPSTGPTSIGYYRPDPGPLTNARVLVLGGGVEIAVAEAGSCSVGPPLPGLGKGVPMLPADDDGRVYVVDLAALGCHRSRSMSSASRADRSRCTAVARSSARAGIAQDERLEEPASRGPCGRGRRRVRRCRAQADEPAPLRLPIPSATRWPCSRARRA